MKTSGKQLYRSDSNKVIFGVMGGLGEYFDIDPTVFRVAYAAFSIFSALFPGVIAYLIMAAIMPAKPKAAAPAPEPSKEEPVH